MQGFKASIALTLLVAACNNPGGASSTEREKALVIAMGGTQAGGEAAAPQYGYASLAAPAAIALGGAGGSGGTQLVGPPFGVDMGCSDAIVGLTEECDDGPGLGVDACTSDCKTHDQSVWATSTKIDRYLGAGRHPVAGLNDGFIATVVEYPDDEPTVGATLFDIWGRPIQHVTVSLGASPVDQANPVAAALPNGKYVVAWSDFDGDSSDLGVALREVGSTGAIGALRVANAGTEFSQLNPDVVWTGTQLIVAWEDYSNTATAPDLRYRAFDADLNPLGDDVTLAATAQPEAAVALTRFGNGFAVAYREGSADGKENIVVVAGNNAYRLEPVFGGMLDDRPGLAELDATHLLVVFSGGTDPGTAGVYNTPRLRYAVIDTSSTVTPPFASIDPWDDIFASDLQVAQIGPSVARGADGAYVAWRSEARSGDAAGDQIWLKYMIWQPARIPALEWREQEQLLPRTCENSFGDQRTPALARVELPPSGALAIAWDDYSHSQATNSPIVKSGDPDVVLHYAPLHPRLASNTSVVGETWAGSSGAWPSKWTHEYTPASAAPNLASNEGRVSSIGLGTTLSGLSYVNDRTAVDVDATVKVNFGANQSHAGLFARRQDGAANTYLAARFSTVSGQNWRIYPVVNGVAQADLASIAQPAFFYSYAQKLEHRLRFRVVDDTAAGTISLKMKVWVNGIDEPVAWNLETTMPANHAYIATFRNRVGRFGVHTSHAQLDAETRFDDFRATFIEGSNHGDPSATPAGVLMRAPAPYRDCRPGQVCGIAEACCIANGDCGSGLSCQGGRSEELGLGSHARTCLPTHCANQRRDGGETRVDCGGADCAACSCTSAASPGTVGYCSASCLCGIGEGACTANSECLPGLVCAGAAYKYGLPASLSACVPQHCMDRMQNVDETGKDCGGSCGTTCCAGTPNGGAQHCSVSCPCPRGEGACTFDDECAVGLVCGAGAPFGLAFKVCVAAHCINGVKDTAPVAETGIDCGGPDCGPICP